MNKLVLDKEILKVENEVLELVCKSNKVQITVAGDTTIYITDDNELNLDIILEDNSNFKLLLYSSNKKGNNKIFVKQNNNTNFIYKEAFRSSNNINITLENILLGNNNKSDLKLRCISDNNKINIDVLINAIKDIYDNEAVEDIKGINNGGLILIEPNIEVNTDQVVANHLTTIGDIDANALFYLKSKGISESVAKSIILEGFLKGIFRDEQINILGGDKD